ncbi:hypothetical protein [Streptomyces sp. NPDC054757]
MTKEGTYSWGDGLTFDGRTDAKSVGLDGLASGRNVNMLLVQNVYYYSVIPQASGRLKGKHWVRIDLPSVIGESNADAMTGGSDDPTQGIESLKYTRDARRVGKETVLGRAATHYHATLSKDDLGAAGPALGPESRKRLLQQFPGSVDSISFDIWIDGHDKPVRMKEDLDSMKVVVDYKKFGPAKPVRTPSSSDIADLSSLFRQMQTPRPRRSDTSGSGQAAG